MDEESIEIPEDFYAFLEGIGHIHRFKIIIFLMKKGKANLDEIVEFVIKEFQKDYQSDLGARHDLRTLELAGIIQNYIDKTREWYEITPLGKELCTALINAYNNYFKQKRF